MDYKESQGDFNRRIEREMAMMRREQSQFFSKLTALSGHPRYVKLGRTVTDADAIPIYPEQGIAASNCFPFQFLSGGFATTMGTQTPSFIAHESLSVPQATVLVLSGNWIPPNTEIQVWQDIGTESDKPGMWWTPYMDRPRLGITAESIDKDANGDVTEYAPDGYDPEASAGTTWLCRNWFADLEANTRVWFQQMGSVAYILGAACEPEA